MQTDEEVGKVAAPVPVIISRALELFAETLLGRANDVTQRRGARTLTPSHLKLCIETEGRFDFLRELVSTVPDLQDDEQEMEGDVLPLQPSRSKPARGGRGMSVNCHASQADRLGGESRWAASYPLSADAALAGSSGSRTGTTEPTAPTRGTGRKRGRPPKVNGAVSARSLAASSASHPPEKRKFTEDSSGIDPLNHPQALHTPPNNLPIDLRKTTLLNGSGCLTPPSLYQLSKKNGSGSSGSGSSSPTTLRRILPVGSNGSACGPPPPLISYIPSAVSSSETVPQLGSSTTPKSPPSLSPLHKQKQPSLLARSYSAPANNFTPSSPVDTNNLASPSGVLRISNTSKTSSPLLPQQQLPLSGGVDNNIDIVHTPTPHSPFNNHISPCKASHQESSVINGFDGLSSQFNRVDNSPGLLGNVALRSEEDLGGVSLRANSQGVIQAPKSDRSTSQENSLPAVDSGSHNTIRSLSSASVLGLHRLTSSTGSCPAASSFAATSRTGSSSKPINNTSSPASFLLPSQADTLDEDYDDY